MVSLGLHEGRFRYKKSIQFSKETNQQFKHDKFKFFLVSFALLDPDTDDQN